MLGTAPLFYVYIVFVFNLMSKPAAFYVISTLLFVEVVCNQLKSIYIQQRPYWVSDKIIGYECQTGYGNPSGHLLVSTFFFLTLYLHVYYDIGVKSKRMSVFCTAYIVKMAVTALVVIYLLLLAVSRVYVGAHSWN